MATILAMETTSLADAKNRLSELVSAVQGTWERVTITKNGKPVAVLIAVEDLESLVETLEVLSGPEAAEPVSGPGRADQEGPRLLQRAGCGRVHGPALRQVPPLPALTSHQTAQNGSTMRR